MAKCAYWSLKGVVWVPSNRLLGLVGSEAPFLALFGPNTKSLETCSCMWIVLRFHRTTSPQLFDMQTSRRSHALPTALRVTKLPAASTNCGHATTPKDFGALKYLSQHGYGSKPRTPSEHPNPHTNRLKCVVHLPTKMVPLVLTHGQHGQVSSHRVSRRFLTKACKVKRENAAIRRYHRSFQGGREQMKICSPTLPSSWAVFENIGHCGCSFGSARSTLLSLKLQNAGRRVTYKKRSPLH